MRKSLFEKLSAGTRKKLESNGIRNEQDLQNAFDNAELLQLRAFGIVSFNEVCQVLKKYRSIRYIVDNTICTVCKGKLVPSRWQDDDKEWIFGYVCSCTEKHRGKIGLDYAI